jgi:hypothetical protein
MIARPIVATLALNACLTFAQASPSFSLPPPFGTESQIELIQYVWDPCYGWVPDPRFYALSQPYYWQDQPYYNLPAWDYDGAASRAYRKNDETENSNTGNFQCRY